MQSGLDIQGMQPGLSFYTFASTWSRKYSCVFFSYFNITNFPDDSFLDNCVCWELFNLRNPRNDQWIVYCFSWFCQSLQHNLVGAAFSVMIKISTVVISQGLEMDSAYCHWGEQSCLQLFWLIVTWWQRQQGWAGLASDTEHQPSLLAHIQPSALISRYVLTIALMCLLSGRALLSPSLPCLCVAPAASLL